MDCGRRSAPGRVGDVERLVLVVESGKARIWTEQSGLTRFPRDNWPMDPTPAGATRCYGANRS
jgi:hypothetical protein